MLRGLFVYKRENEPQLKWFMQEADTYAKKIGMDLRFLSDYNLVYGYIEGKFKVRSLKMDISEIDFVINFSRNPQLARCFECMGIRVVNQAEVDDFCNDKSKMHFAVNVLDIKSEDTYFVQKTGASLTHFVGLFPLIVKTVNGFGGNDVHLANDQKELVEAIGMTNDQDYLIQKYIKNYNATSIKVFVLGGKVFGAVKKMTKDNYKTSFASEGESYNYTLTAKELAIVNKILKIHNFELASIDFIIGYGDEWYFNEIETVITGKEMFEVFNISLPEKLIDYISKNVRKKK